MKSCQIIMIRFSVTLPLTKTAIFNVSFDLYLTFRCKHGLWRWLLHTWAKKNKHIYIGLHEFERHVDGWCRTLSKSSSGYLKTEMVRIFKTTNATRFVLKQFQKLFWTFQPFVISCAAFLKIIDALASL